MKKKSLTAKLISFFRFPLNQQSAFAEAWFLLFVAKITVWTKPFKKISKGLGTVNMPVRENLSAEEEARVQLVRIAISRAHRLQLWKSVCLDQAMAAHKMLSRRSIPSVFCLGAITDKKNTEKLLGHAWIICGSKIIVGGQKSKKFVETIRFAKNY